MMQSGGMNTRSRIPTLGKLSRPTKTDAIPKIVKETSRLQQQGCLPGDLLLRKGNTSSVRGSVLDVENKDTGSGNVPRNMRRKEDQVEETATRSDKG